MRLTLNSINRRPERMKRLRGKCVRIYSGEHRTWWRPDGAGYTHSTEQAGVYDFADAWQRTRHCGPEKKIEYVTVDVPLLAFRTIVRGFEDHPNIHWAESAGAARTECYRAMDDAGYPADYRHIRVCRAPEYDHLVERASDLHWGISEEYIPRRFCEALPT